MEGQRERKKNSRYLKYKYSLLRRTLTPLKLIKKKITLMKIKKKVGYNHVTTECRYSFSVTGKEK